VQVLQKIYIGKRINERRAETHINKKDLAKKVNINVQNLYKYELGRSAPTIEVLTEIADVLRVPISYFYDGMEKFIKSKNNKETLVNTYLQIPITFNENELKELAGYFFQILDSNSRQSIITLAKNLSVRGDNV